MAERVQLELWRVVRAYGRDVADDDVRLRTLMDDGEPGFGLLLTAQSAGIPRLLAITQPGADPEDRVDQLARRLERAHGMGRADARWAVGTWAFALGMADEPPARERPRPKLERTRLAVAVAAAILLTAAAASGITALAKDAGLPAAVQLPVTSPAPFPTAQAATCPPADDPHVKIGAEPRPAMQLEPGRAYMATVETSCGVLRFALDEKAAPVDVNNFVTLARAGFYDWTVIHAILPGDSVQGGDPLGVDPDSAGTGSPGYLYDGDRPSAACNVGSLVMSDAGAPGLHGSQFRIVTGPAGCSAGGTVIGGLLAGRDVLDQVAAMPRGRAGHASYPADPVVVQHVSVTVR